ncbi:hypothetical protein ACFSPU_08595 [Haoranjiania flava]|uniref:Uncharacterized protein n=1 Tax=Haoranjiania flava TaxID=1856322 RepID=A0AAE3LKS8_9BACT|nr:hypothetical protein [Haoranjiania flava]MCU7694903.1 hypothetical protein [Haoranjiania flava]
MPGNLKTWLTVTGIIEPDIGSLGINPDILIEPTSNGIAANEDELLNAAINTLNK